MIKEGIQKLVEAKDLTFLESRQIMTEIISGHATESQIGAFLTALRLKGETVQEITAFATSMKEFCATIAPRTTGRLVDTCGTGGDKVKTLNVSTLSAFVIAGVGISVAKHGNRAVTSNCGSADLLEQFGFNLDLEPKTVERIIEEVGIGFMFAPKFHPAMKHVIQPRREIGIRTVFNILGPLTNPAKVNAQVLGVYDGEWTEPLAHVLKVLGSEEALVVHGVDGVDEISLMGTTLAAWLKNDEVTLMKMEPKDFGFGKGNAEEISGASPKESAEVSFKLLNGILKRKDPKRTMVIANASAGIVVGAKAEKFIEGTELADESIESGAAYKKLKNLVRASGGNPAKLEELEKKFA